MGDYGRLFSGVLKNYSREIWKGLGKNVVTIKNHDAFKNY